MRASRLAAELGLTWEGDDVEIRTVVPLSSAKPQALTFARKAAPAELPPHVCVIAETRPPAAAAFLRSTNPRFDFVKALLVLERLGRFERASEPAQVHPSVVVGPNVSIGKGVVIGEGTRIEPNVTIADNTRIGKDCWLKSGCVIGEAGFGLERDTDGTPIRMLHFGGVVIGDRVEIGAVTTVCQGTLVPTVVEDDAKIDDHVHIAHNCRIGKKSFVIACAELSGGVVLGECVWIGPNASVLESVKIADRAFVGIGAVVLRDVAADTTVVGNPARVLERKQKG
ncbi:MAG: bacterial transferase hexapeptide family protein 3 [Labilithrix sp.]|nr:bacterial transferase hexapeptide family protein 3 [Labilithrix sp.]